MTFWPPHIVDLASRADHASHLVVADWLEEQDCAVAAAVFRDPRQDFWRQILSAMAEAAPDLAPRGDALIFLEVTVRQIGSHGRRLAESVGVPYGFDLTPFLNSNDPPPLPSVT